MCPSIACMFSCENSDGGVVFKLQSTTITRQSTWDPCRKRKTRCRQCWLRLGGATCPRHVNRAILSKKKACPATSWSRAVSCYLWIVIRNYYYFVISCDISYFVELLHGTPKEFKKSKGNRSSILHHAVTHNRTFPTKPQHSHPNRRQQRHIPKPPRP
jgi:hypothetical protein